MAGKAGDLSAGYTGKRLKLNYLLGCRTKGKNIIQDEKHTEEPEVNVEQRHEQMMERRQGCDNSQRKDRTSNTQGLSSQES